MSVATLGGGRHNGDTPSDVAMDSGAAPERNVPGRVPAGWREPIATAPNVAPDLAPSVLAEGARPVLSAASLREETLIPKVFLQPGNAADSPAGITPNATTSFDAYFRTYPMFPDAAATARPNRTAEKRFFYDPVLLRNYSCSAATIRGRLVVTAGWILHIQS